MFEDTRRQIGLEYDARLIVDRESFATVSRTIDRRPPASAKAGAVVVEQENEAGLTLSGVYERFLADPTKRRSARTMLAHHSTRRVMEEVLGAATPLNQINREACRELLEILRWLPVNVTKKFPRLTVREAAMLAKKDARITTINATNLNAYMSRFTTMLNWAVNEEYLGRNPARGLQWADTVHPQDRRKPFELWQLQRIFSAPIYTDCLVSGEPWTKGAKGWIPLLALHSGARLNELAQLDVADVRQVDGVTCIVITASSATGARDKSLKTKSSERIVPVHPVVLDCGFMAFVQAKKRSGSVKLFDDLPLGAKGFRSVAFSRWFSRFLISIGASAPQTCFHSFRHGFRDAARNAKIERDIALRLGGWITGGSQSEAADAYGSGYHPRVLFEAISKIEYTGLDLSHLRRQGS